jgi:cyclic beta-1,2-glucan synthetase
LSSSNKTLYAIIAFAVSILPCGEFAVIIINRILMGIFKPAILPKLEFTGGIPDEFSTMAVVPTILPNEDRVSEILSQLELMYLGNRDKNLRFAIAGDFKDCASETNRLDQAIIKKALSGIERLNRKYSDNGEPVFFFMHRKRQFNQSHGRWMGWERKRGAIIEFNRLLKGAKDTSYAYLSHDVSSLPFVKYVITLDADTMLPMGTAKRLIGAMAHPLNQPYVDPETGIVTEGYGLLQPRVAIGIQTANKSKFTRIFAGQGGIDPYTTAVSDVYQDVFGEGIFTGKGVYDLDVFMEVLDKRFPENSILSHDLLEGCHLRTGLVTDIELVDGYPSRFNSYAMRLHRWVRGDWQLLPWLGSKVGDADGNTVSNPLSTLSKWKIFDNLRRSLFFPSLYILILAGLAVLPGYGIWLGLAAAAAFIPLLSGLLDCLLTGRTRGGSTKAGLLQSFLLFSFIPFLAFSMADAILRTLGRIAVTKRNLLEWVTAADAEASSRNDLKGFALWMWGTYPLSVVVIIAAALAKSTALDAAVPVGLIWVLSPLFAYIISKPAKKAEVKISPSDIAKLRQLAIKTWRYFEDFINEEDNHLPPDNYQEEPPKGIAHRTSPTNIGLLLLSVISACDLGFVSVSKTVEKIGKIISTIEKLEKWKGHLYNWYNTTTLMPLRPKYVSTVDSGNFIGYLMVLKEGLSELSGKTIPASRQAQTLIDMRAMAEGKKSLSSDAYLPGHDEKPDLIKWRDTLDGFLKTGASNGEAGEKEGETTGGWNERLTAVTGNFKNELYRLFPAAGHDLSVLDNIKPGLSQSFLFGASLKELDELYKSALNEIKNFLDSYGEKEKNSKDVAAVKEAFDAISKSHAEVIEVLDSAKDLIKRIESLISAMDLKPLYDHKRQLFSIGYNEDGGKLSKSYYDLLASEARQASYIAIARGEVDPKHWFRLGRRMTSGEGGKGLVSWTGTMFEYFMPNLIMKNFNESILSESCRFVVRMQRKYGKEKKVPWGFSESGFYAFDANLNYQYKAFGVPDIGFKRGLGNDIVVAPYASILALDEDPNAVIDNLADLDSIGMLSDYGYYEAIDYTPSRLDKSVKGSIVKSFMAHHQGMVMAALNNFLNGGILRERFHRIPYIKAAELLLQERSIERGQVSREFKEEAVYSERRVEKDGEIALQYGGIPNTIMPAVHLISNGSYSVMVTDGGAGYSKHENMAVTRWTGDQMNESGGMFIYILNVNSNDAWSAGYLPMKKEPSYYNVTFASDKAKFSRRDGNLETTMEITVSPEDNAEVRRISVTNHSAHERTVEVTSYMEAVLAPAEEDAAHPAFSKLFVRTEYVKDRRCLIASRRNRRENGKTFWMMHTFAVEGDIVGDIQYETDRLKFIGRNRDLSKPLALEPDQPLSNTTGAVLDPIMSLRCRLVIKPGETRIVSFTAAMAESRKHAVKLAEKYGEIQAAERTFGLSWTRSQAENRYLGVGPDEMELFLKITPLLLYYNPKRREYGELIRKNRGDQEGLWSLGISGDLPIVMVNVNGPDGVKLAFFMLKAHEFWRMKGFAVDLVILIENEEGYSQTIRDAIRDKAISIARDVIERKGGIFIKNRAELEEEKVCLLMTAARVILEGNTYSIVELLKKAEEYRNETSRHGSQSLASGFDAPSSLCSDKPTPAADEAPSARFRTEIWHSSTDLAALTKTAGNMLLLWTIARILLHRG